jgi:hypothetical protein
LRRIRSRIQSAGCDIGLGRRNRPSTTQDVPTHPQEAYEPPARLNHCGLWGRPSSHLHGGTLRPSDSSGHQGTTRALYVPARPLQANGPPARACTPCDGAQGRHKNSLLSCCSGCFPVPRIAARTRAAAAGPPRRPTQAQGPENSGKKFDWKILIKWILKICIGNPL